MTETDLVLGTHQVAESQPTSFAIATRNLSKNYGSFTALKGLNLSVPKGIVYGLLGPNGAGKTTAVRIVCGLTKQSSGDAWVFGERAGKSISREIGYMPQEVALYLDLSVMDNIELYGHLYGVSGGLLRERTKTLLGLVGLSEWRNTLVSTLSGGMKRKASLVCAMIHNPKALILDEPTVGVDPTLRAALWDYFGKTIKSGSTIVITTHYMDEATRCDLVGFINNGAMIAEGRPEDILKKTGCKSMEDAFIALSTKKGVVSIV